MRTGCWKREATRKVTGSPRARGRRIPPSTHRSVAPAKAGAQRLDCQSNVRGEAESHWVPAFAGTTDSAVDASFRRPREGGGPAV
ncbi:hypothetical protein B551_0225560 [Cupriavidus sp. HPC(L)]|nr:hypothetical protein B551_0225560 [Cupriavidus sp. HPC(L)]